jgi:hypothetical protein
MAQQNFNVSLPNDGLGDELRAAFVKQQSMNTELYTDKIDVLAGFGLSENNYTTPEQTKLAGIQAEAEKNVQSDFNQEDTTADDYIKNRPSPVVSFPYRAKIDSILNSNDFILPANVVVKSAFLNGSTIDLSWIQVGTTLTYLGTSPLVVGDYFIVHGEFTTASSLFLDDRVKLIEERNVVFTGGVVVPNATTANQAVNKSQLDLKADQLTTFTKTEVDNKLLLKADQLTTFTKIEVDNKLILKLDASAYNDRFKGKYITLSALQTAFPTANAGDYGQVDAGAGSLVKNYNYDVEDGWVIGSSGSGATNTDALVEGSSNLYFTTARVRATILTGLSLAIGTAITASDSILVAFGKLQKQITDNIALIALKQNKSRTIYQGYTTVTGVTVPTIACSVLIPALTYEAVDGFSLTVTIDKSVTATAVNYNLYSDTVLNGTAQAIATNVSLSATQRASAYQRILNLFGGNSYNNIASASGSQTPYNSVFSSGSTRTFNPAVNNYITLEISGHTVASETSSVTLSIQPLKG